jgi:hypothetical protein
MRYSWKVRLSGFDLMSYSISSMWKLKLATSEAKKATHAFISGMHGSLILERLNT